MADEWLASGRRRSPNVPLWATSSPGQLAAAGEPLRARGEAKWAAGRLPPANVAAVPVVGCVASVAVSMAKEITFDGMQTRWNSSKTSS